MLRQLFYGTGKIPVCVIGEVKETMEESDNEDVVCFGTNCILPGQAIYEDAKPREIFIAVSFLILITGIGLYPKLATQLYDVKTVAVNQEIRQTYLQIAEDNPQMYADRIKQKSNLASAEI